MACWYEVTSVAISPFCELARWRLERAGIAYHEFCHAPLLNVPFTKWAGGGVNVPVIRAPDAVLEARPLLDYLDERAPAAERLYPSDVADRRRVEELVIWLFTDLAIAVRLYAYAYMLPNAQVTGRLMTTRVPWWESALVRGFYPLQAWAMRKALGITPASVETARLKIVSAFETLSAALGPQQRYLTSDTFTVADLTFAAVTAPITLPPEYGAPLPTFDELPPPMQETVRQVQASPAGQLALGIYREERTSRYRFQDTAPSNGEGLVDRLKRAWGRWISSPGLLRPLFTVLRRYRPVWVLGGQALISRYDDVVEVLGRDEDFTIAEINAARMERISGPFILGMDRSAQHARELAAITCVVERDDLALIGGIVKGAAEEALDAARRQGRLDVANNYSRAVAARVVSEYFGVPGPTAHILMQWLRSLFWDVFLNRNDEVLVRRAADASAVELRAYLTELIAVRRAGAGDRNDLLTRLVRARTLDDDAVRRNITGIIVGVVDTTVTATVNLLDELLRNSDARRQTQAAAADGDHERLTRCCYEALRFRPQTPALLRHSQREVLFASGARVAGQLNIVALTLSGMFDGSAFPEPGRFRADRNLERYLHFGGGAHPCYGRLINGVQIPTLVGRLLVEPGLRRAVGSEGRIAYEGPFPDRLVVALGT